MIIFAQYRSTARMLTKVLNTNDIPAREFVGKGVGVTQAQQQAILAAFRDREFSVLVATSIGEEGLDVPAVDAVVFYEPIPNEIRNIQRKGRAGRMKLGRILHTHDEEHEGRDLPLHIEDKGEEDARQHNEDKGQDGQVAAQGHNAAEDALENDIKLKLVYVMGPIG